MWLFFPQTKARKKSLKAPPCVSKRITLLALCINTYLQLDFVLCLFFLSKLQWKIFLWLFYYLYFIICIIDKQIKYTRLTMACSFHKGEYLKSASWCPRKLFWHEPQHIMNRVVTISKLQFNSIHFHLFS